MTLLYLDSFDNYANVTDLARRWTVTGTNYTYATTGRSGSGRALTITHSSASNIQRGLGSYEAVIYCGFAYRKTAAGGTRLITFYEGGTEQGGVSFSSTEGQLYFRIGASTAIAAAPRLLRAGVWYYIEVKYTVSNSLSTAGLVLRVNGEIWLQVDVGDSQVSANAWADTLRLDSKMDIDDFYISNSAFLNDMRVDSIRPDGNGTTSDFTGSDADSIDNYLHVDDIDPDGDSSYIESQTVGHIDLHTLESLAVTPATIFGVQPVSICKKTDTGPRTASHVLRTGATNYTSSAFSPSNGSYLGFETIWEENPNTVVPWVNADITGLESGLKVET